VGSLKSWSKEGTVGLCQSKDASILWSHHGETRELPGEKDNARNSARCMQAIGTKIDDLEWPLFCAISRNSVASGCIA